MFQLTRPAGGEPRGAFAFAVTRVVSTHSPRGGRTARTERSQARSLRFNSLAPRGANRTRQTRFCAKSPFQLTRPAGGEPYLIVCISILREVSTPSPRGGRTRGFVRLSNTVRRLHSLAPRGANPTPPTNDNTSFTFQLTRPAGGEPQIVTQGWHTIVVSTHSPRGGRTRFSVVYTSPMPRFNSLAPRGANLTPLFLSVKDILFQLTRPAGGEPGIFLPFFGNF